MAGKDAQQNETLYKKYLKKGDIYVSADIQGAASVVIRNNPKTPDAPIPPSTLSQAGTLAVSCSSAWDSKAGMSAWWANANQVSKSAYEGDFLPPGHFHIKGNKNFLPPAVLLLGFGLLFHISDDSKVHHTRHRHQDAVDSSNTAKSEDGNGENDVVQDDDDNDEHDSDDEDEDEHASDHDEQLSSTNPLQSQDVPPSQSLEGLKLDDVRSEDGRTEDAAQESEVESETESVATTQPVTGTQTPSTKGPTPLPRGKRNKAKKAALKYKDQDESDRIAAQKLLGTSSAQAKTVSVAVEKAARDKELAFQKERRRAQHQRTLKETAEHEEKRKALFEAGETEEVDAEEESKQSEILESLVGTPLKGDEILEAIPVCAPWAAMGKYKYKVKLQPGSLKKGKAVKEILGRWVAVAKGKVIDEKSEDLERMWPREVELIKGFRVEEVTNIVPVGKVRVMLAGGSAGAEKGKGGSGKGGRGGKGGKKR